MERNEYPLKLKKLSSFIQVEFCVLFLFIIFSVITVKHDVNYTTLSIGMIASMLILVLLALTPLLIAAFFGKKQFDNKKNMIWCWIFGIISFCIAQYFMYCVFSSTDDFSIQIGSLFFLEIPNILYIYYCYRIS